MTRPSTSSELPVLAVLDPLLAALAGPGAAVLVAPPGTGKTTAVPPVLAEAPWAAAGRILVAEPRRLAARAAAARMAEVDRTRVGERIGYAVRGERRAGPHTRVEVVTVGLLVRRIQDDPSLDGVAAVLLDEFHERSIEADLAMAMLLDVRESLRPDLRLLVMSATVDPAPIARLLGGDGPAVPVVEATAPRFEVRTLHRPGSSRDPWDRRVADVVREALATDPGDVLVFLPGRAEIRATRRRLESTGLGPGVEVAELHGSLSIDEQRHVVRPADAGRRRVILSTSLAESAITVPGVRVVVDAGRRRTLRTDVHTGLPALRTGPVSRAGADQRRGRAGRVAPGVCYRLWSPEDERHRPAADLPEILDGDLAPLALQLRAWGVEDPAALRWLDPPPVAALDRADALLGELGALDGDGRLGARGRELARIGFHPRLAAVAVEGGSLGEPGLAADVIALLETSRSGDADLVGRVRSLRRGAGDADVEHSRRLWARALGAEPRDRRAAAADGTARDGLLDEQVAALLLSGYADRVARRRDTDRTDDQGRPRAVYHLRHGGEVALWADDPLAATRWIVVADLDAGAPGRPGRVHLAAPVPDAVVDRVLMPLVHADDVVEWDRGRHDVVAERRRRLGAIALGAEPLRHPDPDQVLAALLHGVRTEGLGLLGRLDRADGLRRRVAWLRATRPDDGWPDWSDDALVADLERWLAPALHRARRASALRDVDVIGALRGGLGWPQLASLDELAPTEWTTATGRRVPLRYGEVDGEPATVLAAAAVRDLLGTDRHPTVGPGGPAVTIEVLSPAGRPVQRTQDLPGFWRGSYAAVRADLRGRYPRHPWPERPWEPQG